MTLVESGDHISLMATSLALLDAEERGVHALAALLGAVSYTHLTLPTTPYV